MLEVIATEVKGIQHFWQAAKKNNVFARTNQEVSLGLPVVGQQYFYYTMTMTNQTLESGGSPTCLGRVYGRVVQATFGWELLLRGKVFPLHSSTHARLVVGGVMAKWAMMSLRSQALHSTGSGKGINHQKMEPSFSSDSVARKAKPQQKCCV